MEIDPHAVEGYMCRTANIYEAGKLDLQYNKGATADLFQRKQMIMFTLVDCGMLNKNIRNQKAYSKGLIHKIITTIV